MVCLLASLALLTCHTSADRGTIPSENVTVYEPYQYAIILWNGTHESLLLSVGIYSSAETYVFEVLPLPSLPEVELASLKAVDETCRYVEERTGGVLNFRMGSVFEVIMTYGRGGGVEVVFHETLEYHDIAVVKVSSSEEFTAWLEDYAESKGVALKVSPSRYIELIESYLERGFSYFVVDVIRLGIFPVTPRPLLYTFESSKLYFPLKISSLSAGKSRIRLFTITREKVNELDFWLSGFEVEYVDTIASDALRKTLDREIHLYGLFDKSDALWLTYAEAEVNLGSLEGDLLASTRPDLEAFLLPGLILINGAVPFVSFALAISSEASTAPRKKSWGNFTACSFVVALAALPTSILVLVAFGPFLPPIVYHGGIAATALFATNQLAAAILLLATLAYSARGNAVAEALLPYLVIATAAYAPLTASLNLKVLLSAMF